MRPVRFSRHALSHLADREIERAEVERTLSEANAVELGEAGRKVYMRRYDDVVLGQAMLLRVVVEETDTEVIVVTVYKTSRIRRYLEGGQS